MSTSNIQLIHTTVGSPFPTRSIRIVLVTLLSLLLLYPAYGQTVVEFPEKGPLRSLIPGELDTSRISSILEYVSLTRLGTHKPDSAFELMSRTLEASRAQSFSYGTAASLYYLGISYAARSRNKEAENYFRQAASYSMTSGRGQKLLPHIFNNLGRINHIRGDFRRAAAFYYQGIMLAEHYMPDVKTEYIYSNLAAVLMQLGRSPANIRHYLDKAESAARKKQDHYLLGNVLINKGTIYNGTKAWDSSIRFFNEALETALAHNLHQVAYLAYSNLGTVYMEKNMPLPAARYLEKAEALSRDHHIDLSYLNNTATVMGATYTKLGRYKEAEKILLAAQRNAAFHNQHFIVREAHWNLARLYGATGAYEKAYRHSQAYIAMNDSLAGGEIIRNVNQVEVKLRMAEKDKELMGKQLLITRQERDLEHKNFWIAVTLSVAVIIALASTGFYRNYLTKKRLMAEKLSGMEREQEIGRLRAMMEGEENERNRIARELHDGIGGLVTAAQLNALMLGKEYGDPDRPEAYQKMAAILDDIGNEVRKTAHNLMPEILLHNNLPEAIRHFCRHIQQNRKLQLDVQTYGDFDLLGPDYRLSVYRIVQELTHNVVKHAAAERALIQIILHPPVLSITIEDNGRGFDAEHTGGGAGLLNIRNRVLSMNGTCSIKSVPDKGTSVYIEIGLTGDRDSVKNPILQQESC